MKNAFQAFAVDTSDQKINKFVYDQWALSGCQNSFKNYLQAEEDCYKKFENQIKAAFNFDQRPLKNSPAITYTLTTRTPGPNQRTKNNGMAHLKINYKYLDDKGMYNEDNYYSMVFYSKLGGVTPGELNKLEFEFLILIRYNLLVQEELYKKYYNDLMSLKSDTEEEYESDEDEEGDNDIIGNN